jgi:predicted HAD superfamily Cof-like phosphohydrolase
MNKMQMQVMQFHSYYNVPILNSPQVPANPRIDLRIALIIEELKEFCLACGWKLYCAKSWKGTRTNLIEVADSLGDLLYVVFGSAIEFGLDMEPIVDEIHRSNLSKLGRDGKPIFSENGKVLKGPNFSAPDLAGVIARLKDAAHAKS